MEEKPVIGDIPKWPTMLNADNAYHVPKEDFAKFYVIMVTLISYLDNQYELCGIKK